MLRIRGRPSRAFTLLEVVAMVAVLAILAAALVPSLMSYLTRRNTERAGQVLLDLESSIVAYKAKVTFYPFRISQLGTPAVAADTTSCSGIGPATPRTLNTKSGNWSAAGGGPFFHRTIPATGFPTPVGVIIDTLYRTSNSKTAGLLPLIIRQVSFEDAVELNQVIDGTADANQVDRSNTTGKLIWAAPVAELVDVKYNVSTTNTC